MAKQSTPATKLAWHLGGQHSPQLLLLQYGNTSSSCGKSTTTPSMAVMQPLDKQLTTTMLLLGSTTFVSTAGMDKSQSVG
jgi:hypothetical protein